MHKFLSNNNPLNNFYSVALFDNKFQEIKDSVKLVSTFSHTTLVIIFLIHAQRRTYHFSVIFIFLFLASIQLDGMLRNGARTIFKSSSGSGQLGIPSLTSRICNLSLRSFSEESQKERQEQSSGAKRKLFASGMGFMYVASNASHEEKDQCEEQWDEYERIEDEKEAYLCLKELNDPKQPLADEKVKSNVSFIKEVIFKDIGIFTEKFYEKVCNQILHHQGEGFAIHPKLLAILLILDFYFLNRSSKYAPGLFADIIKAKDLEVANYCASLRAAIQKNIHHMHNQELHLAIAECNQFLNAQERSLGKEAITLRLEQDEQSKQMIASCTDQESYKQYTTWVAEDIRAGHRKFAKRNLDEASDKLTRKIVEQIYLRLHIKEFNKWATSLQLGSVEFLSQP